MHTVLNLCLDTMIAILSCFFKYVITSLLFEPTEISWVYSDSRVWQPWLLHNNAAVSFQHIIYVFSPNLLYFPSYQTNDVLWFFNFVGHDDMPAHIKSSMFGCALT
jgi:hypothetical protein